MDQPGLRTRTTVPAVGCGVVRGFRKAQSPKLKRKRKFPINIKNTNKWTSRDSNPETHPSQGYMIPGFTTGP